MNEPNPCAPISRECHCSKEPLTLALSIFSPVSSVPGSSSFIFFQPLLTGKVFASVGVVIAAQIILFLANRFFGLESFPVQKSSVISPEQTVKMSLSDLQNFLASVSRATQPSTNTFPPSTNTFAPSTSTFPPSTDTFAPSTDQAVPGIFPAVTPEIPVVVALAVGADFTNKPFCPTVSLFLPLVTFPGVRGALPLLILELLTTIFVRAVVPPESTGSKPLTNPASNSNSQPLQFSPEDLLNLLKRFSKHFDT